MKKYKITDNRVKISFGLLFMFCLSYLSNIFYMLNVLSFLIVMYWEYFNNVIKFKEKKKKFKVALIGLIWLGTFTYCITLLKKITFLYLVAINSISDISQYFGGKYLSKFYNKRPFPSISPKKTLVGYFSGIIITMITSYIFIPLKMYKVLLVIIYGILGDLFASKIKRLMKIKDFSNLLGSHGGFLDRFDSLMVSSIFYSLL